MRLRLLLILVFVLASAQGDPAEGKKAFAKLRCDTCHKAATTGARPAHPLPDLTAEAPHAVADMIRLRNPAPPNATFDEMAMASAVAHMTPHELGDIVAYLRKRSSS